jgi:hypothetical protein
VGGEVDVVHGPLGVLLSVRPAGAASFTGFRLTEERRRRTGPATGAPVGGAAKGYRQLTHAARPTLPAPFAS